VAEAAALMRAALALVGDWVRASNLHPEMIDVGGGFPFMRRGLNRSTRL
jgi:diaminopimelate decarboxylase